MLKDRMPIAEGVYAALRTDLKLGHYRPGERIDATAAAMRLRTSLSPVRAALHRLTGEGLVDLHPHEGFSVPRMTEVGLREHFEWDHRLVQWGLSWPTTGSNRPIDMKTNLDSGETVEAIEVVLTQISRRTPNLDLRREVANSCVRLHLARTIEVDLLPDLKREVPTCLDAWSRGDFAGVATFLQEKHERRRAVIPQIVDVMHQAASGDG